jgi:hypothetical protein
MNPFADVDWNPDREAKRRFALSLMIGFPCLALALLLTDRLHGGLWHFRTSAWLAGGGFAVGIVLRLVPSMARPFYVIWFFLGCCMGLVMGNVLLSAFFFLIMTPVGTLMRAFGRKAIRKGFDKDARTYWEDAETVSDVRRYYRQF